MTSSKSLSLDNPLDPNCEASAQTGIFVSPFREKGWRVPVPESVDKVAEITSLWEELVKSNSKILVCICSDNEELQVGQKFQSGCPYFMAA